MAGVDLFLSNASYKFYNTTAQLISYVRSNDIYKEIIEFE